MTVFYMCLLSPVEANLTAECHQRILNLLNLMTRTPAPSQFEKSKLIGDFGFHLKTDRLSENS